MFAVKALSHVAVCVADIERAVAFYCGTLGLAEQFRLHHDDGRLMLVYIRVAPMQFIELFGGASGPHQPTTRAGPVHLCLEVDDIHAAFGELTAKGCVPLHGEPICPGDHAWQFWIADPDGNPIEFHQFTPASLQLRGRC